MTITFISNFLNHHQLPLCLELIKQVGDGLFYFVSCESIPEERSKMGYEDMNTKYPFVVRDYETPEQHQKAIDLAINSDVVILGSASRELSEIRYKQNKLTFLFRERLFKNGSWRRFYPPISRALYEKYTKVRNKNFFFLAASAYAARDVQLCGFKSSKCLKWGYFPVLLPKVEKSYDKLRILWCGRMIWWKHPEDAVEVARILKERGIPFEMKMIGDGDKRNMVEELIQKYGLNTNIHLHDFMPPEDIRNTMNASNVYLFTSGKQEGWGVVLNEAMNSGCVVIANRNAGSSPYLIEDKKNGILYDGTFNQLRNAVDRLLDSDMQAIGDAAFDTMYSTWNPTVAASNLVKFIKSFNGGQGCDIKCGPCSKA